jgi:hypothetical protein
MTEPHQPYQPRTPGPLSAGGFACAAVALIWLPVPFGLAGILLGVPAERPSAGGPRCARRRPWPRAPPWACCSAA